MFWRSPRVALYQIVHVGVACCWINCLAFSSGVKSCTTEMYELLMLVDSNFCTRVMSAVVYLFLSFLVWTAGARDQGDDQPQIDVAGKP